MDRLDEKSQSGFLTFVKLFFGMGILWIFEIISGFLADTTPEEIWYVFDILNMLQGVYLFVIFVLKHSVLFEIRKKYFGQGDNIDMLSLSDGNNGTISNDHTLPLHLNDGTDKFEDTPIVQKSLR